jgi:hypothetical protein
VDHVERVDHVALGLRHLVAVLVGDDRRQVDRAERHLAHEVQAHHHHPGDPEEDDVGAGDQDRVRIEARQVAALVGPAQGRERPQRRREPGVEDVVVLAQLGRAAARAGRGSVAADRDVGARAAVPGRDAMAPPQLARDAPVLDVGHPVHVGLGPQLGDEAGLAALDRGDRRLGQRLGLDEPLLHQHRLDHRARALRAAARHLVLLDRAEEAGGLEVGDHLRAGLFDGHPDVGGRRRRADPAVRVDDLEHRQAAALAALVVVHVVGRRDLDRARAEAFSTKVSATIGMRRPVRGSSTSRPTRSR